MSSGAGAGSGGGGDDQIVGQNRLTGHTSDLNQHETHIEQWTGEKRHHFVAKIVNVYNRNSLDKPCTVDIQPVVKMPNGDGKTQSHGTIYGIPVLRNQSGDSVIVNDPSIGDVASFSVLDRDHTSSQANDWQEANPGSQRRSHMSDATFHAVIPRKAQQVKQHIVMDEAGVAITQRDGHKIAMTKGGVNITTPSGVVNINGAQIDKDGNFTSPGKVVAGQGTADQVSLQSHGHSGNGAAPTPGT